MTVTGSSLQTCKRTSQERARVFIATEDTKVIERAHDLSDLATNHAETNLGVRS